MRSDFWGYKFRSLRPTQKSGGNKTGKNGKTQKTSQKRLAYFIAAGLLIPCELFNRTTEAWAGTALCPRDRQVGPGWTKCCCDHCHPMHPHALCHPSGQRLCSRQWWGDVEKMGAVMSYVQKRCQTGEVRQMWSSGTIHHTTWCAFGFHWKSYSNLIWFREFATSNMFSLHFSLVQFGPMGALPVAVRVKLSGQRLWTRTTRPMHQIVTDSPTIL
jgi:hypothetical protein